MPLLKALQDVDCKNGEKVNVLSLKSMLESKSERSINIFLFKNIDEKVDLKQIESLEEIFKRLSFKSIDLEGSQFDADDVNFRLSNII